MSEVVGYRLLDGEGSDVQVWGGAWGQTPAIPNPIILPNGDAVHAPALGAVYQGYTLEVIEMDEPAPTPADVKAEAARRIEAIMPFWMVAREVSGGAPIPPEIRLAAQAIRDRSGEIEAMDPIPADYADDAW